MSLSDGFVILVTVLSALFVAIVSFVIFSSITNQKTEFDNATRIETIKNTYYGTDYIIPLLFSLLYISAYIFAFSNPAITPAIIVVSLFIILILSIISETIKYGALMILFNSPEINDVYFGLFAEKFPLTYFLLSNLTVLNIIFFMPLIVITFMRG